MIHARHMYYCFYSSVDSLYSFICGFDAAAGPNTLPPTLWLQHDLSGDFLPKLQNMNHCIYIAISKDKIFKRNSLQ